MHARSGLFLVLPTLIFAGCASQQSTDAQTAARQELEGRITKLEADYAAQTTRLDQLGPSSTELKSQIDALRSEVASEQTSLSTLLGKVDKQATTLSAVTGKVDDQATTLAAVSDKVDNQAATLAAVSDKVDNQAATLSAVTDKVDNQTATLSAVSDKVDNQAATLSAVTDKVDNQAATLSAVTDKVDNQAATLAAVSDKVGNQATALSAVSDKVDNQASVLAQTKETANDAVKIARDSRMVSGKIIDSLLLTDDMVLYNYEQPELTAKGKAALDKLIKRAVPQLPYIFIEILGYSDDVSLGSQNRRIALERGESVRRYLFEVGGIPLHRMSVISYGDLKPLTRDDSLEGRSRNRRVTIQVLK